MQNWSNITCAARRRRGAAPGTPRNGCRCGWLPGSRAGHRLPPRGNIALAIMENESSWQATMLSDSGAQLWGADCRAPFASSKGGRCRAAAAAAADLAVQLHGGQQHELVDVEAHGARRVDGAVEQQRVALGAQVRAQLDGQRAPWLLHVTQIGASSFRLLSHGLACLVKGEVSGS